MRKRRFAGSRVAYTGIYCGGRLIRVLVIEDNDRVREMIVSALQQAGYITLDAASGAEGLRAARGEDTPDLVLLDILMPDLDGLGVLQRLKSEVVTAHIPVVMLTAQGEPDQVKSAIAAGAAGYILKPFSPRDLIRRVGALLG